VRADATVVNRWLAIGNTGKKFCRRCDLPNQFLSGYLHIHFQKLIRPPLIELLKNL
jgi:hypothetical protein